MADAGRRAKLNDRRRKAWDVLDRYYLQRAHLQLNLGVLVGASTALVFSGLGQADVEKRLFLSTAYSILPCLCRLQ